MVDGRWCSFSVHTSRELCSLFSMIDRPRCIRIIFGDGKWLIDFQFFWEYFFNTVIYFCSISYNIVSILIASWYVGGCSSIQYLGGESIIPSSRTDSFVPALKIQNFKILIVIIIRAVEINKNIKDAITEFSANVALVWNKIKKTVT